ncbi:hypothetical protein K474DRAFT_1666045 [Panus rudis PR-1116 ss-1]|nr:hypothetical protein K474DRAFT_1666045 [Panus rudis PR-1116 ss-1]
MSSTKLPSVTKAHTVAALNAMIAMVRTHADTSFFANNRNDVRTSIDIVCANNTTADLTKVHASTVGTVKRIGYDFKVDKPGMTKETFHIWIEGPSEDVEVNRRYLIRVLQDIIDNPHAGKTTFNGGALQ